MSWGRLFQMWGPKFENVRKPWVLRLKRLSLSMRVSDVGRLSDDDDYNDDDDCYYYCCSCCCCYYYNILNMNTCRKSHLEMRLKRIESQWQLSIALFPTSDVATAF